MRIAQINLPLYSNEHTPLTRTHEALKNDLLVMFKGFTMWEAQGAWIDESGTMFAEPVMVYQVAYEPDHTIRETIRSIAKRIGRMSHQFAVFIVLDGESEIIEIV